MAEIEVVSPHVGVPALELGRHLSVIRERAGIKQAELAKKVTWSQAVLSRVESGDRALAPDELRQLVSAIDTPEAARLGEQIQRDWRILERPPLDHPEQDALWKAETVAQQVESLRRQPDLKHAFERRLTAYMDDLKATASLILKRDHQVAFAGKIGIGKSTAICRLTGLELPGKGGPEPVLEVGAGGTTVCEVHLRHGPQYGLLIEPRSEEAIRADVLEFANYIRGEYDSAEEDAQGVSKEIERAIRGLSNLHVSTEKGPSGKRIRKDPAKDLAAGYRTARELCVAILSRMELHRRDKRDIWYEPACGKAALEWLKDTFSKVNNGRHDDFTLPKRIEVVVPDRLLSMQQLTVRLIDTKGIDGTAARADLENLLDDPHTLVVLCSDFNGAPAPETQSMLKRAQEAGVRGLSNRVAILVLPHPGQARSMKDDATRLPVDSVEEGYALKEEQIQLKLQPQRLDGVAIGFFNSFEDDPAAFRDFLTGRLTQARNTFLERLEQITRGATSTIANQEAEELQAVREHAGNMLRTHLGRIADPDLNGAHLQDSLLEQLASAHAATVRATMIRDGEWYNLNYGHHLGHGARRMAAAALSRPVDAFTELCNTMVANKDYAGVGELVALAARVLETGLDEVLRKLQLLGQGVFRDELRPDSGFWAGCVGEWGQGRGYKDRVANRNREWFDDASRRALEDELRGIVKTEWTLALAKVSALLEAAPAAA